MNANTAHPQKTTAPIPPPPPAVTGKAIFTTEDKTRRTILIPNLTPEFSHVMRVAFKAEGYTVGMLPLADEEAIALGKRYVHNDICFPAQLNIGELIAGLKNNSLPREATAVGVSKNCLSCRALQYYALARKAMDDAGFQDIPIITTGADYIGLHPGMKLTLKWRLVSMQGMVLIDALNDMRQKMIPYVADRAALEALHHKHLLACMRELETGYGKALRALETAIREFNEFPADRSARRPRVGIIGEILVNYHPAGNYNIVDYLLNNGIEPYLPPLLDFFRQDVVNAQVAATLKYNPRPILDRLLQGISWALYNGTLARAEKRMRKFKFYEKRDSIFAIAARAKGIMSLAFNSGEGWLLPAEIVTMIQKGIRSVVIVQPFGCLPNHVSGRGVIKPILERYPDAQLLSLDFDPDISMGNIENRLQMLIINAKLHHKE